VQITSAFQGELANVPLGAALDDTLGRVNCLATRVTIGGTLKEPTCALWSNLGPAVAEAMEQSLRRAADEHAKTLVIRAGKQVDERLAEIERQVVERQTKFATQTASLTRQLEGIAGDHVPRYRISAEQLGRRLPENSLFR